MSRQAPPIHKAHPDSKQQGIMQSLGNAPWEFFQGSGVVFAGTAGGLNIHFKGIQVPRLYHPQAIFRNLAKFPYDGFDCSGVDIVSSNKKHVVRSSEDPSIEEFKVGAAACSSLSILGLQPHHVTRPVAQEGTAASPKVGKHQLASISSLDLFTGAWLDNLDNEILLQRAERPWAFPGFIGNTPNFCHPVMVSHLGPPQLSNALACTRNQPPRLASDNKKADEAA